MTQRDLDVRDLRDPAAIGDLILSTSMPGAHILERADNLPHLVIPDYEHDETSQSHAQRAYREEHERKAAQGVKASRDVIAYLDDPDKLHRHPGSDVADVDLSRQTRPLMHEGTGAFDSNGDLVERGGD